MQNLRFDYFASTPSGLEPLLERELVAFGAKNLHAQRGGVAFQAEDPLVALKAILHSRLASRVFKLIHAFEANGEKSMYQDLAEIDWKEHVELHQTFRLSTIYGRLPQDRTVFTNSQFTNLKAKDAIVDWYNHHVGRRPSVDKDRPDVSFLIRVDNADDGLFQVQLMLDLCGNPLSNRGHRKAMTEAPLRENLAAGILQLLDWKPESESLVDGMCGSGTFLIEGALIAGGVSPQYLKLRDWKRGARPWAFLECPWFTRDAALEKAFAGLAATVMFDDEAGLRRLNEERPIIVGNDNSSYVLKATRENLRTAGLADLIPTSQKNAEDMLPHGEKSLFICNPPYGERLMPEQLEDLKALYHGMGENWKKNWKGHRAGLITGNLPLLKSISLRTSQRITLYNGDIECRLAEYRLY